MYAVSSTVFGILAVFGSLFTAFWLLRLALYSSVPIPQACQACEDEEDDRPALQHDWNCPLRLAFFGGQPDWDQRELQTQNGVVFYFDKDVGSWRPQLWDSLESHQSWSNR